MVSKFRPRLTSFVIVILLFTVSCDDSQKVSESTTVIKDMPQDPTPKTVVGPRQCDDCSLFDHDNVQREYLVHIPENITQNAPLVFLLHGSGGNADNFQDWLEMNKVADVEEFAVVYPQGLIAEHQTHWNAGLNVSTIDDVGFLSALARYLQKEYQLHPEKTFAAGYSNGGFMAYELLAKSPDVFKAAASFNGTMSGNTWKNREVISPAPLLQISGALDQTIPIDGSLSPAGGWGGAPHMDTILDFWADLNECTTTETTVINGNTTAIKYQGGVNGNEVWYYLLDDFGHDFPLGENGNVNTSELVWEFFSKY